MRDRQKNGMVLISSEWPAIATLATLLAIPAIWPGPLGWTQGFIPVPVSYLLVSLGTIRFNSVLMHATLIAVMAAAFFGSVPALLFTGTMVPVGIVLGKSHLGETGPAKTGLQAVGVLLLLWILFWSTFGAVTQTNPYQEMLTSMDESLSAASSLYQKDASLSLSDKEEIENTIGLLQDFLHQLAPALLVTTAIITVWLNMLLGQWLITRKMPMRSTWPPFRQWRLPEALIWIMIGGGITAVLPIEGANNIGYNILLAGGTLYFFQGTAVLAKLFAKWSIPRPIRAFLFAIAILQGTGFLVLAVLGIADIWAGFGTTSKSNDNAV